MGSLTEFRESFGLDNDDRLEVLRFKVDVLDLLEALGVESLEQRGGEIWGLCPWHNDSDPSWSINADPDSERWGLHSCWACLDSGGSAGSGNIGTLVRDLCKLSTYCDALTWLEQWAGVDTSAEARLEVSLDRRIYSHKRSQVAADVTSDPSRMFGSFSPLKPGSRGWEYLTGRGLTPSQIQERGVRMGKGRRFGGRAVFPVWAAGRLVTFYARDITDQKSRKGLYPKGKGTIKGTLYGLDRANKSVGRAYVSEGVFDSHAIERALKLLGRLDSMNSLATLGPLLHKGQAALLKSWKEVVVVPDMKGAARSLVPTCKEHLKGHTLMTAEVDRGCDADDMDTEALAKLLEDPPLTRRKRMVLDVDYSIRR